MISLFMTQLIGKFKSFIKTKNIHKEHNSLKVRFQNNDINDNPDIKNQQRSKGCQALLFSIYKLKRKYIILKYTTLF